MKEEGEQEEEQAHKRVKIEVAGTMKEELDGSIQVHKCLCIRDWGIGAFAPPPPPLALISSP